VRLLREPCKRCGFFHLTGTSLCGPDYVEPDAPVWTASAPSDGFCFACSCVALPGKIWNKVPKKLRRWALFNLITFPVLAAIYTPYNVLWLHYSGVQLLKWLFTAGAFGAVVNLFFANYVRKVHEFLNRRGY